ncbi:type I-E CRISPR-associated protein Cse2/CasB [Streptomyces tardus]|nr:type I-E CRISPR-associated protein Cse2/CasB [Streptomyces tardus]
MPRPRRPRTARLARYDRFTDFVEHRCSTDPGARKALEKGVGKDLDSVPSMHVVIAHLVPTASASTERAYYAVAAMIAEQARRQQVPGPDTTLPDESSGDAPLPAAEEPPAAARQEDYGTSLGATFAAAVAEVPGMRRSMRRGSAESYLNALCKHQINALHRHLPHQVRHLRSLEIPVDYGRLLQDLIDWPQYSGRITRRWLQDFYRALNEEDRAKVEEADLESFGHPPKAPQGAVST